ncbi:type VI secretion system tube protein TssD [Candidatus Lokiarchaeum ossiferum]|uniref:type VI secretion system tube protein TssD n=1 Tax=Candidatus Lokiarchaeum ossiferum TaxID=2951803 RepID=UPI00352C4148
MKKFTKMTQVLCFFLLLPMIFSATFVQSTNVNLPESQNLPGSGTIQMYLRVSSAVQGDIDGSVTTAGHEGSIQVLGYHHQVTAPPSGGNVHSPLRTVIVLDKSSPLLMQALLNRENLDLVELSFYRESAAGVMYEYYRITLNDARLIEKESHSVEGGETTEQLAFEYDTITWNWADGNIEYSDSPGDRT